MIRQEIGRQSPTRTWVNLVLRNNPPMNEVFMTLSANAMAAPCLLDNCRCLV